ncbi:MAG: hypothetical protein HY043_12345 [Verrucomicrobia bacterium]|nr:hypothetical protein [Verrucomicrobiota bacterium]
MFFGLPIGLGRTQAALFGAILLAGACAWSRAEEATFICVVCDKSPLIGKIWLHKAGHVCEDCFKLETRCSICALPVKSDFAKTSDGRIICKFDLKEAVLAADDAQRLFDEARRDLKTMSGGVLVVSTPQIAVNLFDIDYWNSADGRPLPNELRRAGFSQSRRTGDQFTHSVLLHSGRLRTEMAAVCAHEFTHLWINENKPAARAIESDTIEAVCELVAFRLMASRGVSNQLEKIRSNPYTHGRIETLLEADAQFGLSTVLEWVKSGADTTLDARKLAGFRTDAIISALHTAPAPAPPVPATLVLRGILRSGKQRLALINDRSFATNEEAAIRIGPQEWIVRCREIRDDAVVVSVNGSTNLLTLQLGGD